LKVDALSMMDKASESYSSHEGEAKDIQLRLEKLYEYELHKPKNEITTKMWYKLKDPEVNLIGGFIKKWKTDGKLSAALIAGAKRTIGTAFDQVTELESKKIKEQEVSKSIFQL
jgi:hypothetical protein